MNSLEYRTISPINYYEELPEQSARRLSGHKYLPCTDGKEHSRIIMATLSSETDSQNLVTFVLIFRAFSFAAILN